MHLQSGAVDLSEIRLFYFPIKPLPLRKKDMSIPGTDHSACLNCGASLVGKFCSVCGQKVIEPKERTVKHFIYQFLGSAFFLENNFFKNLWYLVTKPGWLANDFIEGRRKRWMPPFSLLLLINIFYFWYTPVTDLNLGLREQMAQPHHGKVATFLVENRLAERKVTLEQYADKYGTKSGSYGPSLIVFHLPLLACFLTVFFYRKKFFFVDHMIFGVYFLAMVLITVLLLGVVIYLFFDLFGIESRFLWILFQVSTLVFLCWNTYGALKRTYYLKKWQAALAVLPVFAAFFFSHFVYRSVLFFSVFAAT